MMSNEGITIDRFSILKMEKSHRRLNFSCGIKSLDEYIQKQANQDSRRKVSITYVLNDNETNKIAGFYTLSSTTIEIIQLDASLIKKLPNYPLLPATLIGRLAIDIKYQKQSFGELLLVDALQKAYRASLDVASYAVVVEAINKNAVEFYKKYDFKPLDSKQSSKCYLPMKTIRRLNTMEE